MKVIWNAMRTPEETNVPALLKRLTIVVLTLVVIVICLAVWSWHLNNQNADRAKENAAVVAQIQSERKRNTRAACETANREHQAIYDFIAGSIPKGQRNDARVKPYLARVRQQFPIRDCRKVTAERVQPVDS